ncbi:ATP-binding cassette domain-containing protein [Frondihabitans australicus]|uniref:ABC-2 type transport system ATP-binding protein n=1 Tax=Frondihabitans australicus TaxID=386892 RepID=A0A495ICR1_9MICO|nr:ATP-binding cassette domain-containing protein [Frondihabitans australicus]RKR73091.1 ABC-2 type transport system ATP-binding protein [Frondihabitans australicus]
MASRTHRPPSGGAPVIEARGLARTFVTRKGREKSEVKAVAGVDLTVSDGEIVGFLGPNGAGKTTTLRMLTTLLQPTAGTATVAGHDLLDDPVGVRRSIGYVSQSGSTSPVALAGEEIVDHGMLYGVSRAQAERRGRELFDQLDLDGLWGRKPSTMSGGQRRRLDIAMGLVHDPTLVFLDEPTTGLDPQARSNLWTHISDLREKRGSTVFLTTHYLDEADALCDRILVIDHGSIVASDTPEALKRGVAGDLVELVVADEASVRVAAERLAAAAGVSERSGDDTSVTVDERLVSARVRDAGARVPELLRALDADGIALESIEVRRPTLDDVFLDLTGRSLREGE